jgi:hypothetical protein
MCSDTFLYCNTDIRGYLRGNTLCCRDLMNILSFAIGFLLLVILSVMIVAEFFPSVSSRKLLPHLHTMYTSDFLPALLRTEIQEEYLRHNEVCLYFNFHQSCFDLKFDGKFQIQSVKSPPQ